MRFLYIVSLLSIALFGKVIDRIELVVNNVPITTYDIEKETRITKIKEVAIDVLINRAVFQTALKERGIYIDQFDIDREMERIAQREGMTLFAFKNYLLQNGKLNSLEEQIKLNLEKRKIIESLNIRVTQKELRDFYQNHRDNFKKPSKIEVTQYSSKDRNSLMSIIKNPLSNVSGVEIKNRELDINNTNPNLFKFVSKSKRGEFTPIVKAGEQFTTFYISDKRGEVLSPFKEVEASIYNFLMEKKSEEAFEELIQRLKAKATIIYLADDN